MSVFWRCWVSMLIVLGASSPSWGQLTITNSINFDNLVGSAQAANVVLENTGSQTLYGIHFNLDTFIVPAISKDHAKFVPHVFDSLAVGESRTVAIDFSVPPNMAQPSIPFRFYAYSTVAPFHSVTQEGYLDIVHQISLPPALSLTVGDSTDVAELEFTLGNTGNIDLADIELGLTPFVAPDGVALPARVAQFFTPTLTLLRMDQQTTGKLYVNLSNTDVRATGYVATLTVQTGLETPYQIPVTLTVPTERVYRYDLTQDGQITVWDVQALIDYWNRRR